MLEQSFQTIFSKMGTFSGEALQIAVKRREAKNKGEKERIEYLLNISPKDALWICKDNPDNTPVT